MTTNQMHQDVEININDYPPPPAYGASEMRMDSTADLAPPPSYDDAASGRDAPPSYNSIYGQMQGARKESRNVLDYIRKVLQITFNTFCFTLVMLVTLAIPIAMITIGTIYFGDCPSEPKIAVYLIVMGTVYVTKSLMDLRSRWQNQDGDRDQGNAHSGNRAPDSNISRLLGCFLVVFFITGNVWIYSIYTELDTENPQDSDLYCHPVLYYFAFWTTTAVYIVLSLMCCCVCCTASAAARLPPEQAFEQ